MYTLQFSEHFQSRKTSMRNLRYSLSGRKAMLQPAIMRPTRCMSSRLFCRAQRTVPEAPPKSQADKSRTGLGDIGDVLGPIGLSYSANSKVFVVGRFSLAGSGIGADGMLAHSVTDCIGQFGTGVWLQDTFTFMHFDLSPYSRAP